MDDIMDTGNTQTAQGLLAPDNNGFNLRTRTNSLASNASSTKSNALTSTKKRKKLDTSLGDADAEDVFSTELEAQVEVDRIVGDVRNFLEAKQSKSHKVSNDVITYVGDKLLLAVEAVRRLALLNAELKGQVKILKDDRWNTPHDTSPSYSSIVRGQRKDKIPPIMTRGKKTQPRNKFELLVQAKDKDDISTPDEIKTKFLGTFDPVTEGIQLKNIRRTKKGVILETAAKEDMNKFLSNTELVKEGLTATEVRKRNPRIIIYDIPVEMEEERITEALFNQNKIDGINKESELSEHLAFKFRRGKRDEPTTNWVLEVSPKMRNTLRNMERIYIGLRRCRVMDFSAITRCYKCQGLGHVAKHCRATKESCGHCGEDGHRIETCEKKDAPRACALCKRLGKPSDHPANNDCPTYNNTVEAWQQNTNYG